MIHEHFEVSEWSFTMVVLSILELANVLLTNLWNVVVNFNEEIWGTSRFKYFDRWYRYKILGEKKRTNLQDSEGHRLQTPCNVLKLLLSVYLWENILINGFLDMLISIVDIFSIISAIMFACIMIQK